MPGAKVLPGADTTKEGSRAVPTDPGALQPIFVKGPNMKRAFLMFLASALVAGLSGCASTGGTGVTGMLRGSCAKAPGMCAPCGAGCENGCASACGNGGCHDCGGLVGLLKGKASGVHACRACRGHGCGLCRGGVPNVTQPGPPAGQVAYPYYTTRGPRDFFLDDPRPLGP